MDKELVLIIQEDKCDNNGCLDKIPDLLSVLPKYGKVIPLSVVEQEIRDKDQEIIDNLTTSLAKLKAHNLTPEEIQVLNVMRATDAEKSRKREEEWAQEKAQLIAEKQESDSKVVALANEFKTYKRRVRTVVGDEE